MKGRLPLAALLFLLAGCKSESEEQPVQYGLLTASPASVKANFDGDVTLTGAGLNSLSSIYVDGVAIESLLPVTVEYVDSQTIVVHFDYAGDGSEHPVGTYELAVSDGYHVGATVGFAVHPFLQTMEHVRTLPGDLHLDGGTFTTWVRPLDHLGALIVPGHSITGEIGMTTSDFVSEDVQLVLASGATPTLASIRYISGVTYDPVNDTQPLSVALTIDQSGSMISPAPGSDPNDERINQSQAFIDRMSAQSEATVFEFHGAAYGVTMIVDWTSDKDALRNGLDTLRTGEGGATPLYDAMIATVNAAATRSELNMRAAIVLTDGLNNTSAATPQDVIDLARSLEIPVFAIGLGNPATPGSIDQATLSEISVSTGGLFFFAEDATALDSVFDSLTEVLRSSYRVEVGFDITPPLAVPGTYDVYGKVRAELDGEDALVQLPAFRASAVE